MKKILLASGDSWTDLSMHIDVLSKACDAGVSRGHLLSYQEDGALLTELFSRDGSGTMVIKESYEQVRNACIDDVGGILELIRPLEDDGILVSSATARLLGAPLYTPSMMRAKENWPAWPLIPTTVAVTEAKCYCATLKSNRVTWGYKPYLY